MGYADGYYYGQGRIICDTSTFSVGDTIRVRSMTDSSKVWNQQVATVGTALVFTVPPYDYYKICTVQTIDNTPTEIGGVYKTVDYGQTYYVDILDLHSLQGIQGILNAHNENDILNIGDEVTIKINNGGTPVDVIFQIAGINLYDSHEVIFVSKHIYALSKFNNAITNDSYAYSTALRPFVQSIFANIDERDRIYLKEMTRQEMARTGAWVAYSDKLWIASLYETQGLNPASAATPVPTQHLFPLFTTQANRIKTYNGTAQPWWVHDHQYNSNYEFAVKENGSYETYAEDTSKGVVPCFRLTADS